MSLGREHVGIIGTNSGLPSRRMRKPKQKRSSSLMQLPRSASSLKRLRSGACSSSRLVPPLKTTPTFRSAVLLACA